MAGKNNLPDLPAGRQAAVKQVPSSYKDPSGFVFIQDGIFYRSVSPLYREHYDYLMKSGLYVALIKNKWMVSHVEVTKPDDQRDKYKILKPDQIPFMNFPYEWSFSQLKDAALLTLDICLTALDYDMILKDASNFNVTYYEGRPTFIDTLSFEKYVEGEPWIAYGQFCRHFLSPLALAAHKDLRFIPLLRQFLDGFPLDFVANLLPKHTLLNMGLAMHIHAHAKATTQFGGKKIGNAKKLKVSKFQLKGLLTGLRGTVQGIKLNKSITQWGDYYTDHNYSEKGFNDKKNLIETICKKYKPSVVLDLGANNGEFSREAIKGSKLVISTDVDPVAVEKNYSYVKQSSEQNILPLYLDVTNPSGDIGFNLLERSNFFSRTSFDCVLALALIHHLVMTYNLPLTAIAKFLASHAPLLIIEFVPKSDSQVERLLQNREDIFPDYTKEGFENAFGEYFSILESHVMKDSVRTLYVLKRK